MPVFPAEFHVLQTRYSLFLPTDCNFLLEVTCAAKTIARPSGFTSICRQSQEEIKVNISSVTYAFGQLSSLGSNQYAHYTWRVRIYQIHMQRYMYMPTVPVLKARHPSVLFIMLIVCSCFADVVDSFLYLCDYPSYVVCYTLVLSCISVRVLATKEAGQGSQQRLGASP